MVPLTDQQWVSNMSVIDAWKQGNGGADTIPSLSRSLVAHYWDISDNTGYDLWNHYGFRYITSIQKSGFQSNLQNNGAERLPVRPFWLYEMPPKIVADPNTPTENYPLFFADNYHIRKPRRSARPNVLSFCDPVLRFREIFPCGLLHGRTPPQPRRQPLPAAWLNCSSTRGGIGQVSGRYNCLRMTAANYEKSSVSDRQAVIATILLLAERKWRAPCVHGRFGRLHLRADQIDPYTSDLRRYADHAIRLRARLQMQMATSFRQRCCCLEQIMKVCGRRYRASIMVCRLRLLSRARRR